MKNKSSKHILISDEVNYISNKKRKGKKATNENSYFKIIYLIFILSLIIINLYYTIIINRKKKIKKDIFNNNYKSEDKKFFEQHNDNNEISKKFLDFPNPPLETIDSKILESIESQIEGLIELIPEERKFFHGIIRKVRPKKNCGNWSF